ncbi:MAG: endolytic transglycosylase MltG [Minisyncoccia bacterium]
MVFLRRYLWWIVALVLLLGIFAGYELLFAPPSDFPTGSIVTIGQGASASSSAQELADAHVIKHPALFRILLRLSGKSAAVQAGAYLFKSPQNVFAIAKRLVDGDYGFPLVKLTFPEGMTVREESAEITNALPMIPADDFLASAIPYEGYLFPDTYFFQPTADAASVIALMRGNFNTKTQSIRNELGPTGRAFSDTVIMASLVEKEAKTSADRKMVAGILYNRLAKNMPLQVDAVFGYIFNRDTYSPSLADLKVDSPYNTYTHTGLPPGPIDNPGLDSLEAAANPTPSQYLYYLTDKNGVMHYATTFAEHQANEKKYLD